MAEGKNPDDAFRVSEISRLVGGWIDRLGTVWIEGELTQRRDSGAFSYLTLRDTRGDATIQVSASGGVVDAAGPLPVGSQIVVYAKPSWWIKQGRLSFQATEIRPTGTGRLLAHLEHLKQRLHAEGLFANDRKRRLPFLPRGIALITAPGSDAERDVMRQATSRWPQAPIRLFPARVQGQQSAAELIAAIQRVDADTGIDVIVIARGGGSFEDLLSFSDEGVVRAVAAARTPVVTGVGHEAQNPIIDLVADVRASTPTHAGQLVVPDMAAESHLVSDAQSRARRALATRLTRERDQLTSLAERPVLRDRGRLLDGHRERIASLHTAAWKAAAATVTAERREVEHLFARATGVGPRATLARGYAILYDHEGASVTSVAPLAAGDSIGAYLADGELGLSITEIRSKEQP